MLHNTQSRCPTSPLMTDSASGLRVYNPSIFFSSPHPSYKCDRGCRASDRVWTMRLEQRRTSTIEVYYIHLQSAAFGLNPYPVADEHVDELRQVAGAHFRCDLIDHRHKSNQTIQMQILDFHVMDFFIWPTAIASFVQPLSGR